ncbi:MAG: LysE family translocator [Gammaproteobacteria bacterium]|nr:LysE family translocator [Gammaproteobacteria bacterium]
MLTAAAIATLTATIAAAAVTPGPAATAIVARAVSDGLRPALALSLGVLTGDMLFLTLAAAGMTAAAQAFGPFFTVVRWAGAAYLVYQGVQLWRFSPQPLSTTGDASHQTRFWRNFGAGLLLMFGHVQAMLFYAALLPGFVDFRALTASDFLVVALLIAVIIGGVNAGYALLAARARRFFTDERAQLLLHRVSGSLLLLAAVLVATRV